MEENQKRGASQELQQGRKRSRFGEVPGQEIKQEEIQLAAQRAVELVKKTENLVKVVNPNVVTLNPSDALKSARAAELSASLASQVCVILSCHQILLKTK